MKQGEQERGWAWAALPHGLLFRCLHPYHQLKMHCMRRSGAPRAIRPAPAPSPPLSLGSASSAPGFRCPDHFGASRGHRVSPGNVSADVVRRPQSQDGSSASRRRRPCWCGTWIPGQPLGHHGGQRSSAPPEGPRKQTRGDQPCLGGDTEGLGGPGPRNSAERVMRWEGRCQHRVWRWGHGPRETGRRLRVGGTGAEPPPTTAVRGLGRRRELGR